MRLARLIADFQIVQARLAHSISHETSINTRVTLMRRTAVLMDQIEAYLPENPAETRSKVEFFLTRAKRGRGNRDLSIALDLINRYATRSGTPKPKQSSHPQEILNRLASRGADQAALVRYVSGLAERTSLLDSHYRHLCTSKGNADFHNLPSQKFESQHMCDLIGKNRFFDRSKMHIDRSLAGTPVSYYYPLQVPVLGVRVMQCFMRPWRKRTDEIGGSMIWVDDVTDKISQAHTFGDVPKAWPDQPQQQP